MFQGRWDGGDDTDPTVKPDDAYRGAGHCAANDTRKLVRRGSSPGLQCAAPASARARHAVPLPVPAVSSPGLQWKTPRRDDDDGGVSADGIPDSGRIAIHMVWLSI